MVRSLFSRDISILILPQLLKDSLAEAVTDKVLLSRNQPDHILTSMPKDTSSMLEYTTDLNLPPQDQITTLVNTMHKDDSIAEEPTLAPHKSHQERPRENSELQFFFVLLPKIIYYPDHCL